MGRFVVAAPISPRPCIPLFPSPWPITRPCLYPHKLRTSELRSTSFLYLRLLNVVFSLIIRCGLISYIYATSKVLAMHIHHIGPVLPTRLLLSELLASSVAFAGGEQVEAHVGLHICAFPSLNQCTIANCSVNTSLNNRSPILHQSHPLVALEGLVLDDTTNVQSIVGQANGDRQGQLTSI